MRESLTATAYTQPSAVSYCAGLTLANGGWRLPKVSELLTLVDPTRYAPPIDSTAFPNIPAGNQLFLWSSSAYVGAAGSAWGVGFDPGYSHYTATTNAFNVRRVR